MTAAHATSPFATVPLAATAAVVLWGLGCLPGSRSRIGVPAALAGGLSLAATLAAALGGTRPAPAAGAWKFLEVALLLLLLCATARWAPRRQAVAAGTTIAGAVALWTLPFIDDSPLVSIAACLSWALPVLAAAVVGWFPRWTQHQRRQAVADARREQRLALARDLHDYVAHDISGMVVQAQAARFVAATDPGQAVAALMRIEKAGLNALASMDRTVQMLHDAEEPRTAAPLTPLPGPEDLADLVERFAGADVRLDVDPQAAAALSREAGATAYRVVVEALTNVRRHAPDAERIDVTVEQHDAGSADGVRVRVVNSPAGTAAGVLGPRKGRGGSGLTGLGERVRALGGVFTAGPYERGWLVVAVLPGRNADEASWAK